MLHNVHTKVLHHERSESSVPYNFSPPAKMPEIVRTFGTQRENAAALEAYSIWAEKFSHHRADKVIFLSGRNVISKSSRWRRHFLSDFILISKKKRHTPKFCKFSTCFVQHIRAWRSELQLPTNEELVIQKLCREPPEVESSRTSLAWRTHFEVFGLGLEASSPQKLACPRHENSTIFWIVKILWSAWKIFWKTFFCGDRLKIFCEDLFFVFLVIAWKIFVKTFFFGEHFRLCPWSLSIPVLGLESVCPRKGCPWPWSRIFFVSLALASSLVSSTPPLGATFKRNGTLLS